MRESAAAGGLRPRLAGEARHRRLAAAGRGETMPVAPNAHPDGCDDPAGRQRNRRGAFLIEPEG
ncbi:hypothetical protein ASF08_21205 [Methylobacterium sp. Leaf85]|nr:hypothetical protein ASF08_21205 [Methylobacterium sp. Leaf85]